MSSFIEDLYEFIIILLIVGASISSVISLVILTQTPIVTITEDKSFISIDGDPVDYQKELTGNDILFMLLNTDNMSPYPRAIKINNSPIIKIDNAFVARKFENIPLIYSPTGKWKLATLLDKKIKSSKYVYDSPDGPYIHYTF